MEINNILCFFYVLYTITDKLQHKADQQEVRLKET